LLRAGPALGELYDFVSHAVEGTGRRAPRSSL
jgi:hypothetical protein